MGSYVQWLKNNTPRRVTWLCGPEVVLREMVIDHIREELAPAAMDYVLLTGGTDKDRDIWAAANQYPMRPKANRLVVVRGAERIKNWAPLEAWLENTRTLPTVYLLFVAAEDDLPYVLDSHGAKTSELKPHIELIKNKSAGALVRCTKPSVEIPKKDGKPIRPVSDMVAWVQSLAPMHHEVAQFAIDRLGADTGQLKNLCTKLQLFRGEPTKEAVALLTEESPGEDYVFSLVQLNKHRAFLALEAVSPQEYLRTLGLVSYWLDVCEKMNVGLRQRKTVRELASMPGMSHHHVAKTVAVAKHYDRPRVEHCRRVLTLADEAVRHGITDSPMQVLTSLW